jgi:hypothetical protein
MAPESLPLADGVQLLQAPRSERRERLPASEPTHQCHVGVVNCGPHICQAVKVALWAVASFCL